MCKLFKVYSVVITCSRWTTLSTVCRLSYTTTAVITMSSCRWSRSWPDPETWLRTRPSTLSSTRSRSHTSVTQELMFDSGIDIGWKKVAEISQNYSNKEGCEKLWLDFACFNREILGKYFKVNYCLRTYSVTTQHDLNNLDQGFPTWGTRPPGGTREACRGDASFSSYSKHVETHYVSRLVIP